MDTNENHETLPPCDGKRYVLHNGLITTPVEIVFHRERAVAFVLGNPHCEIKWDLQGKNLTRYKGWDIKKPYIPDMYPAILKPGLRYYYVSGGITEPLSYDADTNTFCMFDIGFRWDAQGKNLDYREGPFQGADLVVQLPLCLGLGDGSIQSL